MHHIKTLDILWLTLMGLTLATTAVAESADPDLAVTAFIAVVIGVKGRLVVEHFMELRTANRYVRHLMNAYFYVFPLVIILVKIYPEVLRSWTTL